MQPFVCFNKYAAYLYHFHIFPNEFLDNKIFKISCYCVSVCLFCILLCQYLCVCLLMLPGTFCFINFRVAHKFGSWPKSYVKSFIGENKKRKERTKLYLTCFVRELFLHVYLIILLVVFFCFMLMLLIKFTSHVLSLG